MWEAVTFLLCLEAAILLSMPNQLGSWHGVMGWLVHLVPVLPVQAYGNRRLRSSR